MYVCMTYSMHISYGNHLRRDAEERQRFINIKMERQKVQIWMLQVAVGVLCKHGQQRRIRWTRWRLFSVHTWCKVSLSQWDVRWKWTNFYYLCICCSCVSWPTWQMYINFLFSLCSELSLEQEWKKMCNKMWYYTSHYDEFTPLGNGRWSYNTALRNTDSQSASRQQLSTSPHKLYGVEQKTRKKVSQSAWSCLCWSSSSYHINI